MTAVHHLHGVAVASALSLSRRPCASAADLEVVLGPSAPVGDEAPGGEVIASLRLGSQTLYRAHAVDGGYVLRVPGLCDFDLAADLGTAVCRPDPGAEEQTLALVTRGALLALWLGLRGACVLHASAVEWEGRAVVFPGHSGMGKSTVAAWACRSGAAFVSDDLLRLGPGPDATWVGCSPELRLRAGAHELVAGVEERWAGAVTVDERLAVAPPGPVRSEGPVAAVVVPRIDRQTGSLSVEQLDPVEAVLLLASFPRLGWRAGVGLASQFDGVSRLASSVPVFVATIPWGPPFRPEVVEGLLGAVTAACAGAPS